MSSFVSQLVDYQIVRAKIKINAKKDNITMPCLLNLWDISEIYPNFSHDGITIIYKTNDYSSFGLSKLAKNVTKHFQCMKRSASN